MIKMLRSVKRMDCFIEYCGNHSGNIVGSHGISSLSLYGQAICHFVVQNKKESGDGSKDKENIVSFWKSGKVCTAHCGSGDERMGGV